MLELPRGSCRGAPPVANPRHVPLAIQVSKIPRLMGEKFARHIQSRAGSRTGGGESPAARHAREPVLGPTRGKPKLAVGGTKNGPRSEPIAGPRGREQRCRFIQQSAASPKRRFNGGRFAIASLLLAGNGRRQPRSCVQHCAPCEWRAGNGGRSRSSPKLRHWRSMVRSGGPSSPPNGGWGGERSCDNRRSRFRLHPPSHRRQVALRRSPSRSAHGGRAVFQPCGTAGRVLQRGAGRPVHGPDGRER